MQLFKKICENQTIAQNPQLQPCKGMLKGKRSIFKLSPGQKRHDDLAQSLRQNPCGPGDP